MGIVTIKVIITNAWIEPIVNFSFKHSEICKYKAIDIAESTLKNKELFI
jgi:hypothetical protein